MPTEEQYRAAGRLTNPGACSRSRAASGSGPKLYEITAMVSYSVVIRADSKEDALKHVETWEHAWDANADLLETYNVDVFNVRDGFKDDAHVDISSQNRQFIHKRRMGAVECNGRSAFFN